jgi:hypothetical protein
MGVHLYTDYEDPQLPVRLAAIRAYHATGYHTLLTIHANASDGVLTPSMYSGYVIQVLQRAGLTLDSVEITNEGNVPGSPETSDGSNPLIIEDLIAGVEAAKNYARAHDPNLNYWSRVLDTIYAYRDNDGIRSVYVFRVPPTISAASADYGIVNSDGTARPSYSVVRASIAKFDPAIPHRPSPSHLTTWLIRPSPGDDGQTAMTGVTASRYGSCASSGAAAPSSISTRLSRSFPP